MMFGDRMDFNDGLPPYFGAPRGGVFKEQYRCYSVAMSQAPNPKTLEEGGKIIMPPSALSELTKLHIQYPMLFKLSSQKTNKSTHCGVMEFVAEEGKIYIPHWMMINIGLKEGEFVWVENVTLSLATFAKFQPQNVDFLDITDPKAVNFACLTKGDNIAVHYNDKVYELQVLETRPANAVTIIECDMQVDFAPPIGYQDPPTPEPKSEELDGPFPVPEIMDFTAFSGQGQRLDGKRKKSTQKLLDERKDSNQTKYKRGIPYYNFKVGKLTFVSAKKLEAEVKRREEQTKQELEEFKPFEGGGQQLKPRRKT